MNPVLQVVSGARTLEELCEGLGRLLGRTEPLPAAAVLRALEVPGYAADLMKSRLDPERLRLLLEDPLNQTFLPIGDSARGPASPPGETISSAELFGRVTKAFLRWSETGFRSVDPGTLEGRLEACRRCENFVDPPDRMMYRLAKTLGEKGRICRLCGCFVARKARLPDEACPAPDPAREGWSRWGERLKEPGPLKSS
jgi:hypothetical protein